MSLLSVDRVTTGYGSLQVVRDVSFEVDLGEVVALIGANGAGKTTILMSIVKLLAIHAGQILLSDERIDGLSTHVIAKKGVILVPEGRRLFPTMTVFENLEFGVCTAEANSHRATNMGIVFEQFPILNERKTQKAGSLSGGEQEMLAVARGLMAAPKILLLDEPSLGLAPLVVKSLFDTLKKIALSAEKSILLSEQNVPKALSISGRAYVMELGQIVLKGKSSDLLNNPLIRKAYLGY
jgi:branched-chain amino acid transport system ATP-binding protein